MTRDMSFNLIFITGTYIIQNKNHILFSKIDITKSLLRYQLILNIYWEVTMQTMINNRTQLHVI